MLGLVAQLCLTFVTPADCIPPGSSVHGISQCQNSGVGCHAHLQEIFPTEDQNKVSHTAGRFFTTWDTREAHLNVQFSSVQSLSCVQLFATLWTAACQASLSITNSRSSPKPVSIELVMPSNHLTLCLSPSPPALNLSQHQGLFHWIGSSHQVAKVLELQHQYFQWILRVDFL